MRVAVLSCRGSWGRLGRACLGTEVGSERGVRIVEVGMCACKCVYYVPGVAYMRVGYRWCWTVAYEMCGLARRSGVCL